MPGEKIEKGSIQVLKVFKIDTEVMPRQGGRQHQELVQVDAEGSNGGGRFFGDVTWQEWVAVSILCFVNLINYMDRFTLAGVLKDIQDHYKIGDDLAGLLQTAFILSYMLFAPLFGYLGDRYSRRLIMAAGVFLWSLTTLLGSFMNDFGWFITFRAMVGIGEASYSTIAPTIISDLFVKSTRSKMLALFYFAIPVGSGMGYIIGSETAKLAGAWQWGLRVTPAMGLVAVLLIMYVLKDPERGAREGSEHMVATPWREDIKHLVKNPSFMFSTAGFTCVAFVAGALAWWGPKFIYMGIKLQSGDGDSTSADNVAYVFGVVSMVSGILGVPAGSFLAQRLRETHPRIDPHICAIGLLVSSPLVFFACVSAGRSTVACYLFVFFAEFFLNLTWSIVADILLYVVLPLRRSSAEGLQLLISHAFGDAGSPYLIGVISESLKLVLHTGNGVATTTTSSSDGQVNFHYVEQKDLSVEFRALQYALFTTCFVEVVGGLFFLITAFYICKDKEKVDRSIQESSALARSMDNEKSSLVDS